MPTCLESLRLPLGTATRLFSLSAVLWFSGCATATRDLASTPDIAEVTAVTVAAPGKTMHANPPTPPNNSTQFKQVPALLDYADRMRIMPATELSAEVARLALMVEPLEQLKLSLALVQLRQLPALIRAQDTVAMVLGNNTEAAQALHPLARLLAARYTEQRRTEDQFELQQQQVRDLQRRLDQTTERLEALVAIERSLGNRPPPVQNKPRMSLQP
jgi:hypothetical protein